MKRREIALRFIISSLILFGCTFAQQLVKLPTSTPAATPTSAATSTPTKIPTSTPLPATATPPPPAISGNVTGDADKIADRYFVLCKVVSSGCELTTMTAVSNSDGYFEFRDVPASDYYFFYDSGQANFNDGVKQWQGKVIQVGNVKWLGENFIIKDSEGKISFTMVEGMVLDQNGVYMAIYRFFATSPFLWAHECATNCALPDDVLPIVATVANGVTAQVKFKAYGPFGELSGEKPASSTGIPTPVAADGIPVVTSVNLRNSKSSNGLTIFQEIHFQDSDGDVIRVDYKIISSTASDVEVHGGAVNTPAAKQKAGAMITGEWGCGTATYTVTLQVILTDRKGNQSAPVEYTMYCN